MTKDLTVTQTKDMTLRKMLTDYHVEISRALPKHVSVDRMLRIALTSARKNPEILECTPESVLGAIIQSAQLGLEPDTPLGQAYLIPFRNNKTGRKELSFMPGYKGLMDLVYRTAAHPILMPVAVYQDDIFEHEQGLNPVLKHTPMPRKPNAALIHAYCVATFADGRKTFAVMSRQEIDAIRGRSKAKGFSPWQTDFEQMALKTVIKRLVKYLPMSVELQKAVGLDDLNEVGLSQNNEDFLKPDNQPILTKRERIEDKISEPGEFDKFNE